MCSTGSRASEKTLVLRESEQKGDQCLLHFSLYPPSFPLVELVLVTAQEQSEICPDLAMQSCWELSCPLIATCYSRPSVSLSSFLQIFLGKEEEQNAALSPILQNLLFQFWLCQNCSDQRLEQKEDLRDCSVFQLLHLASHVLKC